MKDIPENLSLDRERRIEQVLLDYLQSPTNADRDAAAKNLIGQHPELMPELGERLRLLEELNCEDALEVDTHGHEQSEEGDLTVRCPNCRKRLKVPDAELSDILCSNCGSSFDLVVDETEASSWQPAKLLGHFQLLERIGEGSFGVVWKAHDTELDRLVAVKIPRRGTLNANEVEQFLREARAAAQLNHPNIVSVHEIGRDQQTVYIVSDLVQGASLSDWLKEKTSTVREAAELCRKVALALEHAHRVGVIHRDLKPHNIMLDGDGEPFVMDFGLAKRDAGEVTMTIDGRILGTPAYMSPEQALGEAHQAGPRTDVYSVGVILFELLTGELPFRGNSRMMIQQVIHEDAPSPRKFNGSLPKDIETICLKCLEKEPEKRYASAQELAAELQRFLDGLPIHARPISAAGRAWRWCRRKPQLASLSGTLAAVLLIASVLGPLIAIRQNRLAHRERTLLEDATVRRLAAESQAVREKWPTKGLLLAIEAVTLSQQYDDTASPKAHEALWNAVPSIAGRALVGHSSPIRSMALSSQWMVTLDDEAVGVWDLLSEGTGQTYRLLEGDDRVAHMAMSEGGRWLITGGSKLQRFDLAERTNNFSPTVLASFEGEAANITAMDLTPDGRWLVTHSEHGTTRLWDLAKTRADSRKIDLDIALVNFEDDQNSGVRISPNGRWVAAWHSKNTILLDVTDENSKAISLYQKEAGTICSMVMSSDNRWLITGCQFGNAICWDLMAEHPAESPRTIKATYQSQAHNLLVTHDSRWLFAAAGNQLQIRGWNLATRDLRDPSLVLRGFKNGVHALAATHDGHWLVSASNDGAVRVWDLQDPNLTDPSWILAGHDANAGMSHVAISPDGRWIASASNDGAARLWDLHSGNPESSPLVLRGDKDDTFSATTISSDGRWIATTKRNGVIQLWDLAAKDGSTFSRLLQGDGNHVSALEISQDDRWLVAGYMDGAARLWNLTGDVDSSILLGEHPPDLALKANEDKGNSDILAVDPTGRWLAVGSIDGKVRLWDLHSIESDGLPMVLDGHESSVISLTISPDGRWLISVGHSDGKTLVWDLSARDFRTPFWELTQQGSTFSHSMAVDENGRWLAVAGGKDVFLWDLKSEDPIATQRVVRGGEKAHGIGGLVMSPNGRWLATGRFDGLVQLWDLSQAKPEPHRLSVPGGPQSPAISPDGHWFAVGTRTGDALLWDLTAPDPASTVRVLAGHEAPIWSVAISADSRWLVTDSSDGTVRRWDLNLDSLLHRARATAGRELTIAEREEYQIP